MCISIYFIHLFVGNLFKNKNNIILWVLSLTLKQYVFTYVVFCVKVINTMVNTRYLLQYISNYVEYKQI